MDATSQHKQKAIQEAEYVFPYHYIPQQTKKGFSQAFRLTWGYEYLSYTLFLCDLVLKKGYSSLLDIGCGDGRFLHELSKQVPSGSPIYGTDFSARALAFAKAFNPDIEWIHGDIRDPNVFPQKHSIVTLVEVLEHIPPEEVHSFLKGIHSRTEDENGLLILTVPSVNLPVTPKHYRHFDRALLEDTLAPFFGISDLVYLNKKPSLLSRIISRFGFLDDYWFRFYLARNVVTTKQKCSRIVAVCKKL